MQQAIIEPFVVKLCGWVVAFPFVPLFGWLLCNILLGPLHQPQFELRLCNILFGALTHNSILVVSKDWQHLPLSSVNPQVETYVTPNQKKALCKWLLGGPLVHIIYEVILEQAGRFISKWMWRTVLHNTTNKQSMNRWKNEWIWPNNNLATFFKHNILLNCIYWSLHWIMVSYNYLLGNSNTFEVAKSSCIRVRSSRLPNIAQYMNEWICVCCFL